MRRGSRPSRWSPPARGAWIEISSSPCRASKSPGRPPQGGRGLKSPQYCRSPSRPSRPPQGGRGLKSEPLYSRFLSLPSPPARGAWIEIMPAWSIGSRFRSRPPQGGRGLKCQHGKSNLCGNAVAPREGNVD